MRVQNQIGADIIMAFDDCAPAALPEEGTDERRLARTRRIEDHARRLDEAHERTLRWLDRCVRAHARPQDQALFGIVQGATDLDLRRRSVEGVCSHDLPGFAIGGVAVGEGTDAIRKVVEFTAPLLPEAKPRYLMGVGYERDIVMAVAAGVDMFDCVLPTRNGRNANAFTRNGSIRLRNARFADDHCPIDPSCDCEACAGGFSRAYLRHLFTAEEMLGPTLVSVHNIRHFQRLMMDIRTAIREDAWSWLLGSWPCIGAGREQPETDEQP
jgi:queuine tRNA-ribosyltransferase